MKMSTRHTEVLRPKHHRWSHVFEQIQKATMKVVMRLVIRLRLYSLFWGLVGLVTPRKGVAWLAKADLEEAGMRDAEYVLSAARSYGVAMGRVMDYGCGYGRVAKYLAPHAAELICADVSPTYLGRARKHLKDFSNVIYLKVSGKDLKGIQNGSVDIVYSIGVFVHINKNDAYHLSQEVARVLKPNGLFIVELPNPKKPWPSFEKYSLYDIAKFLSPWEVLRTDVKETIIRYVLRPKKGSREPSAESPGRPPTGVGTG